MGTHGAAGTRSRVLPPGRRSASSAKDNASSRQRLSLTDWPVARRLFAVILAALLMGLVFGGLRVAAAEDSASQFSRTEQLAKLGAQLTTVVDDLQNERDATLVTFLGGTPSPPLGTLQGKTRSDLAPVREGLSAIQGGGFPATVAADALTVNNASDPSAVFADYAAVIGNMLALQQQVALGVTDGQLTSDVQTLNVLALAKDEVSQEQALLDEVLTNKSGAYNLTAGILDFNTETSLRVASEDELTDVAAFHSSATTAESALFDTQLGPQPKKEASETMTDNLETGIFDDASGNPPTAANGVTPLVVVGTSGIPLQQVIANQVSVPGIKTQAQLLGAWDAGMGAKLNAMQTTENLVTGNITTRATQLQQSAQRSALLYLVITVVVLLLVLAAALLVARSLVLPLRRLRAGALDVASVQLPERVRLLSEDPESASTTSVAPINVTSQDEIGQVARAFDRVHSEAVRLAGEQAVLRASFNAMFVNLSRRSQTLIERLARMIDTLEQTEDDPDRLGSLFSMDHLVTRMRRNSENLLLLGGHDNPRKWSDAVPLADVARAATSEIEQYHRVTLSVPSGVALSGQSVSDVVHLLAELIENATIFSPKDTQVRVTLHELVSGGVLIEVIDKGIGVSESRLEDMNWRLDNPPTMDVSVSRHMGLFAVARLAERHQIRVRLRPAQPHGLSALVWLPDGLLERTRRFSATGSWSAQPAGARADAAMAGALTPAATARAIPPAAVPSAGGPGNGGRTGYGAPAARMPLGWFRSGAVGARPSFPDFGPSQGAGTPRNREPEPEPEQARSLAESAPWPAQDSQPGAGLPVRTPRARLSGPEPAREPAPWPAQDSQTAAGLPVRTPQASLIGGGAAQGQAGGSPAERANGPQARGGNTLPQRSPEQARSRLAGFQRGTRRAEGQGGSGGQSPRAGEGTLS
jgi:signal transduction histidine kinase